MWNYIKDAILILAEFEIAMYATKGVVYLANKLETPKDAIIDHVDQNLCKQLFCLPTPVDFYVTYKKSRKIEKERKLKK